MPLLLRQLPSRSPLAPDRSSGPFRNFSSLVLGILLTGCLCISIIQTLFPPLEGGRGETTGNSWRAEASGISAEWAGCFSPVSMTHRTFLSTMSSWPHSRSSADLSQHSPSARGLGPGLTQPHTPPPPPPGRIPGTEQLNICSITHLCTLPLHLAALYIN